MYLENAVKHHPPIDALTIRESSHLSARPTGRQHAPFGAGRPLVGRDTVLADLRRGILAGAADGVGGCTVVEGSPGMGKTRLLETAAAEATAIGAKLAFTRVTDLDRAAPLTTLRSVLHTASVPGLDLPGTPDLHPMWLVSRIRTAMEAHLGQRCLLIVIDDAHRSDELSMLALRLLVPELAGLPVRWLLSRRPAPAPDFAHRSIDALLQAGARRHELEPLDDASVAELCTRLLGGTPDADLLATARRAEGNPFLLAELLSALLDSGQVRVSDGRALLLGNALTEDFATAVGHKLGDLSETARQLLEAASVFGRPFTVHEVAGLVGRSAIELLPAVHEAATAAILLDDGAELAFRHDLIREALYNRLPGPVRRVLHREAADVVHREGRSAIETADHLVRGGHGNDAHAIAILRQAVKQVAPTAPHTAADLIVRMLDLIGEHDPTRAHLVAEAVRLLVLAGRTSEAVALGENTIAAGLASGEEVALLLGLCEALHATGQSRQVLAYTTRALARARAAEPSRAELLVGLC